MKVCIFGSRSCTPTVAEIDAALTVIEAFAFGPGSVSSLICGMAKGADESGFAWATAHEISVTDRPLRKVAWDLFPVEMDTGLMDRGKWTVAAYERNRRMAEECDFALGFWDGVSGGTANMAAHLASLGKTFRLVRWSKAK